MDPYHPRNSIVLPIRSVDPVYRVWCVGYWLEKDLRDLDSRENEAMNSFAAQVLPFHISRGYIPQGLHGLHGLQGFAAQGLQGLAAHGLQGLPAHGLQGFAAQGLHGLAAHGLQGLHGLFTSAPDEPYRPTLILISSLTLRKATCGLLIL